MEINVFGKLKLSITRAQQPQIPPEKVLFDRAHLDGMLRPYFDNKSSLIGIFLSQASILVTIGLTLLVSDIGTKWGIDKYIWNFMIAAAFGCLVAWSFYITLKILRLPSFEVFLGKVISQSLTTQDRRFVFLFFALDSDNSRRILVQYSPKWACWLLPNFGKSESSVFNTEEDLRRSLATKISAEANDVELTRVNEDLISTKLSFKNNKLTTYYFDFYLARIVSKELTEKMTLNSFELAGGKFAWMTVYELKNHPFTLERNGDVIDHLEEKIISNGSSALSLEEIVGHP